MPIVEDLLFNYSVSCGQLVGWMDGWMDGWMQVPTLSACSG